MLDVDCFRTATGVRSENDDMDANGAIVAIVQRSRAGTIADTERARGLASVGTGRAGVSTLPITCQYEW